MFGSKREVRVNAYLGELPDSLPSQPNGIDEMDLENTDQTHGNSNLEAFLGELVNLPRPYRNRLIKEVFMCKSLFYCDEPKVFLHYLDRISKRMLVKNRIIWSLLKMTSYT